MKKFTFLALVLILLEGCVTSRGHFTKNTDVNLSEKYVPISRVEGMAWAPKLWILFIPFGGSSDQGLYNRAYNNAMEDAENSDGVTSQVVDYKRVRIPLVFITYVNKYIKVSGTSYQIKNNPEETTEKGRTQTININNNFSK